MHGRGRVSIPLVSSTIVQLDQLGAVSINLLFKRLVAALKVVVGIEGLVELVFLKFDLVAVTLDHNLLDLILLNSLVYSVLLAGLEGWELIETVGPRRHVVTIKRDTKSFTDIRVVDLGHTSSLLLLELLLGGLDLSSEYHKASKDKLSRYRLEPNAFI